MHPVNVSTAIYIHGGVKINARSALQSIGFVTWNDEWIQLQQRSNPLIGNANSIHIYMEYRKDIVFFKT